jgi:Signal peptidase, peptidase S26
VPFDRAEEESRGLDEAIRSSSTEAESQPRRRRLRSLDEYRIGMKIASPAVPPYSLWVEGDNREKSRDSRKLKDRDGHGPVSKKLLCGVAEYRIWPLRRIGKLPKQVPLPTTATSSSQDGIRDKQRPRAYWPY